MSYSKSPDRRKAEFVYPRMYVALPDAGEADLTLSHDDSPVETKFAADIMIMYAYDMDSHFEIVSNSELKRLGLTIEELHQVSVHNLDALDLDIRAHENEGLHMLTAGGNFEATLLLLSHVWDFVTSMVHGRIVAVIPARDLIFFTGENDMQGLSSMRRQTSRMLEQADKPLSRHFFVRDLNEWVPYKGYVD